MCEFCGSGPDCGVCGRGEGAAPAVEYQPKTGARCHCKPGIHRDNCPDCEGTGWRIDFAKIRARAAS